MIAIVRDSRFFKTRKRLLFRQVMDMLATAFCERKFNMSNIILGQLGSCGFHLLLAGAALMLCTRAGVAADAPAAPAGKTLIDYFLPTPIVGKLTKDAWGADNVLPRDQSNGLEDTTMKQWCYWDGK